jgi:potassium/chloride transporter 4/5/6
VMIGWPNDHERLVTLLRVGRSLQRLNKSLLIGKISDLVPLEEGEQREIHIWWGGLQRNGDLILMLAYLLTCNPEWRNARIRLMSIASNELMQQKTELFLHKLIPEIRIDVEIDVAIRCDDISVREMIHRKSAEADLVLMGLEIPDQGKEEEYAERLRGLVEGLGNFFLVRNSSVFIGELISPEKMTGVVEDEVDKE